MDDSQKQRLRNYAWGYFAIHAEQRMKTFHFYLILSTALISGFILGMTRIDNDKLLILAPIGFLLTLVSFLFFKLDNRNKQLVRNGEYALNFLDELEDLMEEGEQPHILKIFAYDDWKLAQDEGKIERKKIKALSLSSYSQIFSMIFWAFGILGIMELVFCLIITFRQNLSFI
jgi:hypothetical protein